MQPKPHVERPGPDVTEALRRQTHVLVRLSASSAVASGDFERAAREIAEEAAAAMEVARVTIWRFDDDRSMLRCVDRFDALARRHESVPPLLAANHPRYFRSVLEGRTIDAHDALRDARLAEFVEQEFRPLGITAMMDTPVSVGARVVGTICFAHIGPPREWEADEIIFASAMAHQVGLALAQAEKRRVEAEARRADERFREVFEHTTDCIFLLRVTEDGRFLHDGYNPAALRVTRTRSGDVGGRAPSEFLPPDFAAAVERNYRRCVEAGGPIDYDEELDFGDGVRTFHTTLVPIRNEAGRIHRLAGFARDITDRLKADQSLAESQRVLSTLLGNLPGAAYRCRNDEEWTMEFISQGCLELTGYAPEDFLDNRATSLERMTVPEDRAVVRTEVEAALAEGRPFELSYRLKVRDGRIRWVWERGLGIRNAAGEVQTIEGFIIDTTERREAELRLAESEEKFATAFRSSPYSLTIVEKGTGRYLDVNAGFEQITGYSRADVVGRTSVEIGIWADLKDREAMLAALDENRTVRGMEARFRIRGGETILARYSCEQIEFGGRTCILMAAEDISRQREAEETRAHLEAQLRQTQKLEALGQLAGGIAHDFNNILAAIIAYTELAEMDLGKPDEARRHLSQVRKAGDRAKDLVRQILAFSRQQKQERRPTRLHPVIGEVLNLLRSTLPATIRIEARIDERAPVVLADPSQVHQVMMNLCTNAAHAMRDRPGKLEVVLEHCVVTPAQAALHHELQPGCYARLVVRDTGHGMDEATRKRVFDPFFTTKAPGEGTGLGLAVVHGIMKDHEGAILVESEPGQGTAFFLYFPLHETAAPESAGRGEALPRGQGERILFLDDEQPLCDVGQKLLARLGYQVTTATDPVETLRRFLEDPTRFDLVITDLTMPGMTGLDFATEVLATRPDLPVLMVSGFSGTWTPERIQSLGLRELIAKPLTASVLATAVRRHLDAAHKG